MQFPKVFFSSLLHIHFQRVCALSTDVSQTSKAIAGEQSLCAGPLLKLSYNYEQGWHGPLPPGRAGGETKLTVLERHYGDN